MTTALCQPTASDLLFRGRGWRPATHLLDFSSVTTVGRAAQEIPRAGDGDDASNRARPRGCCTTEVLRLYPPFWFLSRVTSRPATIGGYRIPAHADVVFSRPVAARPGDGRAEASTDALRGRTRKCIGDVYRLTEIPLIVATVLRRHAPGQGNDEAELSAHGGDTSDRGFRLLSSAWRLQVRRAAHTVRSVRTVRSPRRRML